MKVKILKTGKVEEYETGYAVRLVEQGKAVPAPAENEPKEKADEPKEKAGKSAGGKEWR